MVRLLAHDTIGKQKESIANEINYPKLNKQFIRQGFQDFGKTVSMPAHWQKDDWLKFSGIAVATGTVFIFDKKLNRIALSNQNKISTVIADMVEPFGDFGIGIFPAIYAAGLIGNNKKMQSIGLRGGKAVAIAATTNLILKYAIGRGRPDATTAPQDFRLSWSKKGYNSMPSGHSSISFAIATAFAEEFADKKWVAPLAYTLAGLTSISRVYDNRHWATDVVVGAALGHFVTKAVYKINRKKVSSKKN